MDELIPTITRIMPTLIAVCETWANPMERDSFYDIPDYTLYRQDRTETMGGGVALYIHAPTCHKRLTTVVMPSSQSLWVELTLSDRTVAVGCTYRPPNSDPNLFCRELELCLGKCNTTVPFILLGDLNSKNSSWLDSDVTDRAGDALSYLIDAYGFHQHVNFATHIYRGHLNSCLDLVISNLPPEEVTLSSRAPFGCSDHVAIQGTISMQPPADERGRRNLPPWT